MKLEGRTAGGQEQALGRRRIMDEDRGEDGSEDGSEGRRGARWECMRKSDVGRARTIRLERCSNQQIASARNGKVIDREGERGRAMESKRERETERTQHSGGILQRRARCLPLRPQ